MLTFPIAREGLKPVARRDAKVFQTPCLIQQQKLSSGYPLNLCRQSPGRFVVKNLFSFRAVEAAYHLAFNYNVLRYSVNS
jgi:hypothetical protein